TDTATLNDLCFRSTRLWTLSAVCFTRFDIECIVRYTDLLNPCRRRASFQHLGVICRLLHRGSSHLCTGLVLFPSGFLRFSQVRRNFPFKFAIHPPDSGKSLVALVTLRRSIAEIPCLAEKVLRRLAFFLDKQRQLLFLLGCQRHVCRG